MYVAALVFGILIAAVWLGSIFIGRRKKEYAVGFFHPYTNDGGGGERVLWCAVRAIQAEDPDLACIIYTGDDATPQSLASRAHRQFGVKLNSLPKVMRLHRRHWVESRTYPFLTLLGQSLGSMVLGMEALMQFTPLIFIDTSGYAFTYPIACLLGCKVVSYTHYPTISSDMVAKVLSRRAAFNNNLVIARSCFLSILKAIYYQILMISYGLAGRCVHLAMVNSSWTKSHIEKIWGIHDRIKLVYPPCDTRTLQELPLERNSTSIYFISVAQFRPEKAHGMQLEAFANLLNRLNKGNNSDPVRSGNIRLKLVGSCRNEEDKGRVVNLKQRCSELGIADKVDFLINVSYRELVELLGAATAGIHSMIDEHFGIVVVEYMAAGAIPIAHNSAGPKMDIVVEQSAGKVGFLATSVDEFASAMMEVINMSMEKRMEMASLARERAKLFSETQFDQDFKAAMSKILAEIRSSHKENVCT